MPQAAFAMPLEPSHPHEDHSARACRMAEQASFARRASACTAARFSAAIDASRCGWASCTMRRRASSTASQEALGGTPSTLYASVELMLEAEGAVGCSVGVGGDGGGDGLRIGGGVKTGTRGFHSDCAGAGKPTCASCASKSPWVGALVDTVDEARVDDCARVAWILNKSARARGTCRKFSSCSSCCNTFSSFPSVRNNSSSCSIRRCISGRAMIRQPLAEHRHPSDRRLGDAPRRCCRSIPRQAARCPASATFASGPT